MSYLADYHGGYCSNPEREAMGPKAYMGYGFWQVRYAVQRKSSGVGIELTHGWVTSSGCGRSFVIRPSELCCSAVAQAAGAFQRVVQ